MTLLLALLLAADPATLYQNVERRLAADPALAARIGRPAAEMTEVAWMTGTWDVTAIVEGRDAAEHGTSVVTPVFGGAWLEIRDTYPGGTQDIGYLGFSPAERRWISVSVDSLANANRTSAERWEDGRAAFEGDVTVLGVRAHLRQLIERHGENEYRVINEELIEGVWHRLDSYRYVRRAAP